MAPISQMMHMLPVPWVEPEDVSNAILFLVSDDARYPLGMPRRWRSSSSTSSASKEVPDQYDLSRRTLT